jgi:hypothetical protein
MTQITRIMLRVPDRKDTDYTDHAASARSEGHGSHGSCCECRIGRTPMTRIAQMIMRRSWIAGRPMRMTWPSGGATERLVPQRFALPRWACAPVIVFLFAFLFWVQRRSSGPIARRRWGWCSIELVRSRAACAGGGAAAARSCPADAAQALVLVTCLDAGRGLHAACLSGGLAQGDWWPV